VTTATARGWRSRWQDDLPKLISVPAANEGVAMNARRIVYIVGGAFLCSLAFRLLSFPLRETTPELLLGLLQVAAIIGGAFYGNAQWRKNTRVVDA
jgi:hypothetical protein